jgi:hypothetical protein
MKTLNKILSLNREVITLIKKIDQTMVDLLFDYENEDALRDYNYYSSLLEDILIKIIELGYNPHNKDIDLLNKDERNIFDCGLKTANKYAKKIKIFESFL